MTGLSCEGKEGQINEKISVSFPKEPSSIVIIIIIIIRGFLVILLLFPCRFSRSSLSQNQLARSKEKVILPTVDDLATLLRVEKWQVNRLAALLFPRAEKWLHHRISIACHEKWAIGGMLE